MQRPIEGAVTRLSAKHAEPIRRGLVKSIVAADVVASFYQSHIGSNSTTTQQARDWVNVSVTQNKKPLHDAFKPLYTDGWVIGGVFAGVTLNQMLKIPANAGGTVGRITAPPTGKVDWNTFTPGKRSASELLRPSGGLENLLNQRNITLDGIHSTTLDRIGTVLADALDKKMSPAEVVPLLAQLVNDPQRALTIAQTEMNVALNLAARDTYQTAGVDMVSWVLGAEGCEDCQQNADESPISIDEVFGSGDTEPPAHPNCYCSLESATNSQ